MQLHTASLHPMALQIDDKTYAAEKLTVGDLVGIGEWLAQTQRAEADTSFKKQIDAEKDDKKRAALEHKRIETLNGIDAVSPSEAMSWLLTNARGQALILYTALAKKHPEMTFQMVCDLTWNDDLIQVCYDLLDIRRRIVTSSPSAGPSEAAKAPSDPPLQAKSGDDGKPSLPTSTPGSPGETSP